MIAAITTIVQRFREALGRHAVRTTPVALYIALYNHIGRLGARLTRLMTLWREGKLPKPRAPRPARVRAPETTPRERLRFPSDLLPHHYEFNGCAGYLQQICETDEDMQRFLREVPQAARQLRPLFRLLHWEFPAAVKLPPRVRKPRPQKPKPEPRPAPKPGKYEIPDRFRMKIPGLKRPYWKPG